ncbi:MAG TPA: GNAT family N-acetyltransferase [Azospirillum sp.]|nr:GNAT family N-acetyltransferase [Azospirillum sp.]
MARMPYTIPPDPPMGLDVRWLRFDAFTPDELYAVLALRQRVFVIEQASLFLDVDGRDPQADHLLLRRVGEPAILGYLRVFGPALGCDTASLGRVVVAETARGRGLGAVLVAEALRFLDRHHARADVAISAQAHLQRFYAGFGFVTVGEPYDDAGIPHVDMRRQRSVSGSAPPQG